MDSELKEISIESEMVNRMPIRPSLVVPGNTIPRDSLVVFFSDAYIQNALEVVDNFKLPRGNIQTAVPENISMFLTDSSNILFGDFRSIRLFLSNEVTPRELIATRDSILTNAQRSLELTPVRSNVRGVVMSEEHAPSIRAEVIFRNAMTTTDTLFLEIQYKLSGKLD